ncbi:MAG: disulfide bond formation protein B [Planctomycetes bacterium]|nr:disulfide bond formation protein B [Planctomycetota bacterium]
MSESAAPEHDSCQVSPSADSLRLVLPPLVVAALAMIGSLWLSVGMGLKACPLCLYQRTFVMGVVAVLGIGVLTGPGHRKVLNLLALPFAVAGFGVAAFHVFLEVTGKLECPGGVMAIGTAPQQSLAVQTVVLILVSVGVARSSHACLPSSVVAGLMGLLLAGSAVISAPPMPPVPTRAYEQPLDMCRPPFSPQ